MDRRRAIFHLAVSLFEPVDIPTTDDPCGEAVMVEKADQHYSSRSPRYCREFLGNCVW